MKSIASVFILLLLISCMNESHYFKKSLSKQDKMQLRQNDSLIKPFTGKSNWYKQYWTGDLLVKKNAHSLQIYEIGEWRQTSRDHKELYAITHFDHQGNVLDETQFNLNGTKALELVNQKDSVSGLMYTFVNQFYSYGQIKSKERLLWVQGQKLKDGTWEYYTESGTLYKTVIYKMDALISQ